MLATCDGTQAAVRIALSCTIPSASFTQSPFSISWGSSILATVTAVNNIGSSVVSVAGNGATILRIPDAPLSVANVPAITLASQIGLTWSPGASNGGTPVLDYKISIAVGAGSYSTLETGITTTSYIALDLTAGQTYTFEIQARNIFGYSVTSVPVTILAA